MQGYTEKIGYIDLSKKTFEIKPTPENLKKSYLGGKGFGVKILYDSLKPGIDPLSKENILIFAIGPLTLSALPQSNRFSVITKSPLTGAIATATCGGNFASKMKQAGFDAFVITGAADSPTYLEINNEKLEFKDASALWGLGTYKTDETLPEGYGKAIIGPAGENKVRFSCIFSDDRVAGRCGCGAVMGSKKLKAIIVKGDVYKNPPDDENFKEFKKKTTRFFLDHDLLGKKLTQFGTANLVYITNSRRIIPVNNYSSSHDERAYQITGEILRDEHLVKNGGCIACPIKCGRVVKREGHNIKGPEYETMAMFGSNIGNYEIPNILEYNYLCDDYGMDTISAGSTISFYMELYEKKLISKGIKFGQTEKVKELLYKIAHREEEGDDLAEGVKRLSEKFGGKEFAMHVKGLELPAYDPRGCFGQGLEYATTNRGGCHVQGATMFFEATGPLTIDPVSMSAKPELVILQQNLTAAINSMVLCVFSAYGTVPPIVFKLNPTGLTYKMIVKSLEHSAHVLNFLFWLSRNLTENKVGLPLTYYDRFLSSVTGRTYSFFDILKTGERIFNLERMFNLREGFDKSDDRLPDRLINEIHPQHKKRIPIENMLRKYYKARRWDESGRPDDKLLSNLGL